MELWTSAEIDVDVYELYSKVSRYIEKTINEKLQPLQFESDYLKWAHIAMIREDEDWADEIIRRSIKRKVLEFRLKINHSAFLAGDFNACALLIIESLRRSVDIMGEKVRWKISENDRNQLYRILDEMKTEMR